MQVGRSLAVLGSTQQQWLYSTSVAQGFDVGDRGQLRTSASYSGRYASGGEAQVGSAGATYFYRQQHGLTFFAMFSGNAVRNPDTPNPLSLGGDTDLRGYPLRYQSGNKSLLVNLEERLYTDWNIFRLIRVGGAVFYDGGRAWGGEIPNSANSGWLNDVGFGLRFLTDRSSRANVVHLDVAFPLNSDPNIKKVQFLVYTRQSL